MTTGCVYGGKLTALIINNSDKPLDNYKIIDIQAKEEHTINKIKKM